MQPLVKLLGTNLITLNVPNQEIEQFSLLLLHLVSRSISYVALRSGIHESGNLKGVVVRVGLRMRTCASSHRASSHRLAHIYLEAEEYEAHVKWRGH